MNDIATLKLAQYYRDVQWTCANVISSLKRLWLDKWIVWVKIDKLHKRVNKTDENTKFYLSVAKLLPHPI